MTTIRSFANQIAAAAAALSLSLVLIGNTVSTPHDAPVAAATSTEFVA